MTGRHDDKAICHDTNGVPERLTPERFQLLVAEAEQSGEPTTPIVRRFVRDALDRAMERARDLPAGD